MIDSAVTNSGIGHAADNLFESFEVIGRIAVHLNIGDMTGVGERMIGSFQLDLFESGDWEVDGDVETVGVVFTICDAGNDTETLTIYADKSSGETFGGGGKNAEVVLVALGEFV